MESNKNSILTLFKEQLRNQIDVLVSENNLKNSGLGLIWWYFINLEDYNEEDIEEILCDGAGDLGIDAIRIDDEDRVHFYQFKNPENLRSGFPTGEVDKFISGLSLLMSDNYHKVANPALKERIEEVLFNNIPSGYTLHLVTSGDTISDEARVKIENFIKKFDKFNVIDYEVEDLECLYKKFYAKTSPKIDKAIQFCLTDQPYMVKSADHESYIFHLNGEVLAKTYDEFGEKLLQRNIRGFAKESVTNRLIFQTATSEEASSFYHYNNGITFVVEKAQYEMFPKKITLSGAQVINGGQTLRILHKAYESGQLKPEVLVSVRVICSKENKEFATNVAVNLNRQTRVDSYFLRSNDPRVVQLANSLSTVGWYLERREGEIQSLNKDEIAAISASIGRDVKKYHIKLKEGIQAYTAIFLQKPEQAKKDSGKIFEKESLFSDIFNSGMTAEKFVNSYRLYSKVRIFVKNFSRIKRKKDFNGYRQLLGDELVKKFNSELDNVIPQSAIFLCSLIYRKHVELLGENLEEVIEKVSEDRPSILTDALLNILEFAKKHPGETSKSWPTLLKSQAFYNEVTKYVSNGV